MLHQHQSIQREQLRREYEEKRAGLDRSERALNLALDGRSFTNNDNKKTNRPLIDGNADGFCFFGRLRQHMRLGVKMGNLHEDY